MAESYYAARSRRDPEWRLRAIAGAAERKRRRREQDPDRARVAHREEMRRYRARLRERSLTYTELLRRSPFDDAATLRLVLADELRLGRVHLAAGRYSLNGGLPDDVKAALSHLEL